MRWPLSRLLFVLGVLSFDPALAQVTPTTVSVEIISPDPVIVAAGQAPAAPIRVQVRATDGSPVAGVVVDVSVSLFLCFPMPPPPPPALGCEEYNALLFGQFGQGPGGSVSTAATTDANGIATVEGFHSGRIAGSYELIVGVYPASNGGLYRSLPPSTLLGVVQTQGQALPVRTIPAADPRVLAVLAFVLLALGWVALRALGRES